MKLKQPNNRTTEQLSFYLLAFFVLATPFISFGQNIHDPYIDVNNKLLSDYPTGIYMTGNTSSQYVGEYEFYLPLDHPWSSLSNVYFRVKTECVSFPFAPIQKYHTFTDQSNNPQRVLGVPSKDKIIENDEIFWMIQEYYNPGTNSSDWTYATLVSDIKLYMLFFGEEWYPSYGNGVLFNNWGPAGTPDANSIISLDFVLSNVGTTYNDHRNYFPHSILKHTLIMATLQDGVYLKIDSIEHVIDLTRGQMAYYPFTNTVFGGPSGVSNHDIITAFEAKKEPAFGQSSNSYSSEHDPNPNSPNYYSTYNYFPAENVNWLSFFPEYIPSTYPSNPSNSTDYVRLPQYSLTGIFNCNNNAKTRAGYVVNGSFPNGKSAHIGARTSQNKHIYTIDKPFDITFINPSEKIVYNPSEVEINLNPNGNSSSNILTFPSGYTFKTVLGNYPEKSVVEAANTNNYYGKTPFNIPVPNDLNTGGYKGYYIIKDGSKLVIEDCVTLMDVEFIVESGGQLSYNSQALYGANFTLPQDNGNTIEDRNIAPSSVCSQYCLDTTPTGSDWSNHTVSTDHTLTANTTKTVFGTLTIAEGTKLTLEEGVRLEFAPNSRVIVEDDAWIIANGVLGNEVILTSMCKNMWDGIELRGKTLNPTSHAVLTYTILENAYTGIKSHSSRNSDDYFGVVRIANCTILNCITGIDIKTPINSGCCNLSNVFQNSDFITTGDINKVDPRFSEHNTTKPTITHIKLNGLRNKTEFVSCTFVNQNTWLKPHERGIGISVVDSWLMLGRHLLTDVNTFTNLSVGIIMSDKLQYSATQIDDAIFNNNIYGIIALNRNYFHLNNNSFIVPKSNYTGDPLIYGMNKANIKKFNRPTGIYIQNSGGFVINDNQFTGTATLSPTSSCDNCNQSIVIDATAPNKFNPSNGLIMRNIFEDINIGVLAQNGNGDGDFNDYPNYSKGNGVSIVCNEFTDLKSYDMALPDIPSGGMGPSLTPIRTQGYCANDGIDDHDHPALNSYNPCIPLQTRNVHNESASFYYYHANNNEPACTLSVNMNKCLSYNLDLVTDAGKCDDYYDNFDPNSFPLTTKRQQYIDKADELEERISSFELLLDKGNTLYLLEVVENGAMATAVAQLETAGTYISDEVLLAAIERLGVEETQKLILILQANSKLSTVIWDAVVTHTNENNSGLVEALIIYQEGISSRDSHIKWIDYTAYERNTIFDGLYFADITSNESLTLTLDVLRGNTDPYIQKKLLPLLISEGEYNEAEALLEAIKQTDNSSLFVLEKEAKLLMSRDAISFYELPENLKSAIAPYWESNPQQSSWSAIQAGINSWNYYISPGLITNSTESNKWNGTENNSSKNELNNSNFLTCYPNPTNSGGTIKGYAPILNNGNNQIRIYNSIGQLVSSKRLVKEQFQITVQLPAKGLYFIALYQNNTLLKHQKWVVQ